MLQFKGGAARHVLLFGCWAIKIPRTDSVRAFLSGMLCNLQERELGRSGRQDLCPVVASAPLGLCVVMPRCAAVRPGTLREEDFRRLVEPTPGAFLPVEWKEDSWGWLDGRLVAVDHG